MPLAPPVQNLGKYCHLRVGPSAVKWLPTVGIGADDAKPFWFEQACATQNRLQCRLVIHTDRVVIARQTSHDWKTDTVSALASQWHPPNATYFVDSSI